MKVQPTLNRRNSSNTNIKKKRNSVQNDPLFGLKLVMFSVIFVLFLRISIFKQQSYEHKIRTSLTIRELPKRGPRNTFFNGVHSVSQEANIQYFGGKFDPESTILKDGVDAESLKKLEEMEKYQIIILGWKRYTSLERLLNSLDDADYGGDKVKLVIQIDGGSGVDWKKNIKVAKNFKWKYGSKEVRVLKKNAGLMNAWLTCWHPKSDNEHAIILEDDLTVSPYFYRYVKNMWTKYGDRPEIASVTLQRQKLVPTVAKYRTIEQKAPFGYKLLGTWGMSPSPKHWREFLKLNFKKLNPHVGGLVTSKWFARQKLGKMWSQFFIWWCHKKKAYNIYLTAPNRRTFATNWREAGVHFGKTKGADFKVVDKWESYWNLDQLPNVLDLYSFGLKKEKKSYPVKATSDIDNVHSVDINEFPAAATNDDNIVRSIDIDEIPASATTDNDTIKVIEIEDIVTIDHTEESINNTNKEVSTDTKGNISKDDNENDDEKLSQEDIDAFVGNNDGSDGAIDTNQDLGELDGLVKIAKKVEKDGIMFLQLFNEGFVEMTTSWACNVQHMPRVLDRTLFLCTDQPCYDQMIKFKESSGLPLYIYFQEHKAPSQMSYGNMDYYHFILFRASLLKALLNNNVSPFIIESDATWFNDPVKYILELDPSYDVIAMHNDYRSPTNINGGFLWLKSRNGTRSVVNRLYKGFKIRLDGLAKKGKSFVGKLGNEQQFFKKLLFSKELNPNGLPAKSMLLPSNKFAPGVWFKKDYKNTSPDPIVVLNNWVRGNVIKVRRAKIFGHWFITENGKQCSYMFQKVPKAADLATQVSWPLEKLDSLIQDSKLINNNIGQMVIAIFARKDNVERIKNWICNLDNLEMILEHTIIFCEDAVSIELLKTFIQSSEITSNVNFFLSTFNEKDEGKTREHMKISMIHAMLRSGVSVMQIGSNTKGFKTDPANYFSNFPAESDIGTITSPAKSAISSGNISEEPIVLYINNDRTINSLSEYLGASQKWIFTKQDKLPSLKKYISKLSPTTITQDYSSWEIFADSGKGNTKLKENGLYSLTNKMSKCKSKRKF